MAREFEVGILHVNGNLCMGEWNNASDFIVVSLFRRSSNTLRIGRPKLSEGSVYGVCFATISVERSQQPENVYPF